MRQYEDKITISVHRVHRNIVYNICCKIFFFSLIRIKFYFKDPSTQLGCAASKPRMRRDLNYNFRTQFGIAGIDFRARSVRMSRARGAVGVGAGVTAADTDDASPPTLSANVFILHGRRQPNVLFVPTFKPPHPFPLYNARPCYPVDRVEFVSLRFAIVGRVYPLLRTTTNV